MRVTVAQSTQASQVATSSVCDECKGHPLRANVTSTLVATTESTQPDSADDCYCCGGCRNGSDGDYPDVGWGIGVPPAGSHAGHVMQQSQEGRYRHSDWRCFVR